MSDALNRVLRVLRNPRVVNGIGLGARGVVGVWLLVNFVKGPQEFVNVALDGLTRGSIYGVVALGYTLVYGILQLINFAHGDVFSLSGLVASTMLFSVLELTGDSSNLVVIGGIIVTLAVTIPLFAVVNATIERVAYRPLRHAPRLDAADHRGRHVVHRLQHLARALRRRLRERLRPDPPGSGIHHRGDHRHVEARVRARDHRARADRAQLVRRLHAARKGDARGRPGHGGVRDDGDQRQSDDLRDVPDRRRARGGRGPRASCSSTTSATTPASSSG